ncbi:MAG: hypothetical protein JEZ12_13000 [Desulfobacterium sp.]|nr:hypothetical protein [Desulfobacterium sp.]
MDIQWQTEKPVLFQDLTVDLEAEICNGCGGKDSWFKPGHADLFRLPCQPHDYDYAVGGSPWDKVKADWRLRHRIRIQISNLDIGTLRNNLIMDDQLLPDFVVRQIYKHWSDLYFIGVLAGGNRYFHFGKKRWPIM